MTVLWFYIYAFKFKYNRKATNTSASIYNVNNNSSFTVMNECSLKMADRAKLLCVVAVVMKTTTTTTLLKTVYKVILKAHICVLTEEKQHDTKYNISKPY
jgi:hypothetical protein